MLLKVLFADQNQKNTIKEDFDFLCEVGKELSIQDIVIVPSFHQNEFTLPEIKKESIKILGEMGHSAAKRGMRLAYEFVGDPRACVNRFEQCYEIIEELGMSNVGISLDFFHFYAMNSNIHHLEDAEINKIFLVHINDADYYPPGSLRDQEDRVFPGDGAIPIKKYMNILREKEYQGLVSIELFRGEYYHWDIETFVKTAKMKAGAYLK
jgi:2-keto-myo-inositol isomerase